MTTTAFDDQFTVGTQPIEPVREPMSREAILRRNVADLELALKQQTERAEAAEAELLAIRDDNHSMMLEIHNLRIERDALVAELAKLREQEPALYMAFSECGQFIRYWTRDTANLDATMAVNDFTVLEFFARPTPAPAVPEEWREVMAELAADLQSACDAEHQHRDQYPSVMRKYNNDMEIVEKARALLQSAEGCSSHSERGAP